MGEALNIRRGGNGGGIEKRTVTSGKVVHVGDPLFLRGNDSVDSEMKVVCSSNIISSSIYFIEICKTSLDTKIFGICSDNKARYITISDLGATAGAATVITNLPSPTHVIEIETNKVIAYNSSNACVLTLNPSAGTFTAGTVYSLGDSGFNKAVKISENTVIFQKQGSFVVCKISGMSLTFGSLYEVSTSSCAGLCVLPNETIFAVMSDMACYVLKITGSTMTLAAQNTVAESGVSFNSYDGQTASIGNTVLLCANAEKSTQRAFRFVQFDSNKIVVDSGWQKSDNFGYYNGSNPYSLAPRCVQISENDVLAFSAMRWGHGVSDFTSVFFSEVFHFDNKLSACGRILLQSVDQYSGDTDNRSGSVIQLNNGKAVFAGAGANGCKLVVQFMQPAPYGIALSGAASGEKCSVAVWDKV